MKTEVNPRLDSGFFISEIELVRIKDAQNEQIKKLNSGLDAVFDFEVKYRNGVISNPLSINDIVLEENDGSRAIIRLSMTASSADKAGTSISIVFSDISYKDNSSGVPISYLVTSNDKDWTFISASVIEERINKVKISKFLNYLINAKVYNLAFLALSLFMMSYFTYQMKANSENKMEKLRQIRVSATGVIDYLYKVDVLNSATERAMSNMPIFMIVIFSIFALGGTALSRAARWYPLYTFYWGDNISKYDRKNSLLKFLGGSVVFALVVGIVGNYFYDQIFAA